MITNFLGFHWLKLLLVHMQEQQAQRYNHLTTHTTIQQYCVGWFACRKAVKPCSICGAGALAGTAVVHLGMWNLIKCIFVPGCGQPSLSVLDRSYSLSQALILHSKPQGNKNKILVSQSGQSVHHTEQVMPSSRVDGSSPLFRVHAEALEFKFATRISNQ